MSPTPETILMNGLADLWERDAKELAQHADKEVRALGKQLERDAKHLRKTKRLQSSLP